MLCNIFISGGDSGAKNGVGAVDRRGSKGDKEIVVGGGAGGGGAVGGGGGGGDDDGFINVLKHPLGKFKSIIML